MRVLIVRGSGSDGGNGGSKCVLVISPFDTDVLAAISVGSRRQSLALSQVL